MTIPNRYPIRVYLETSIWDAVNLDEYFQNRLNKEDWDLWFAQRDGEDGTWTRNAVMNRAAATLSELDLDIALDETYVTEEVPQYDYSIDEEGEVTGTGEILYYETVTKLQVTLSTVYSTGEVQEILESLKLAHAEQIIWELKHDVDSLSTVDKVNIGGMLTVDFGKSESKPVPRFSPRALAALRPFIKAKTVSRYR